MDTAAFDNDRLLNQLTEALRRGPGSPEWHRAVADVRELASPEADEYRLLITARERLESGREYREVRAGPAFTRDLFGRLNESPAVRRRVSAGLLVKLACLLTLVASLGYVVMLLAQGNGRPATDDQLSGRLFVTPIKNWSFDVMPKDLRAFGQLPLEARGGLRAAGRDTAERTVGLLVSPVPIDLQSGTCLEMRVDYKPGPSSVQLVLLPSLDAVQANGFSGSEITIICEERGVTLSAATGVVASRPLAAGTHVLRLKVAGEAAVAEVDGQTLWSGTSELRGQGFAGVRIVRNGKAGDVAVQTLRVLAP